MQDPDLQIGGRGGGSLGKIFCLPFEPQFSRKIRGRAPPGPSPRFAAEIFKVLVLILKNIHPGPSFVLLFLPERLTPLFSAGLKEVNPSLYCTL